VSSYDQSFQYDAKSQLTQASTPTASWSINYDANGNRTAVTLNGQTSTYSTPGTSNRLTAITNPSRTFTHDQAGNTVQDSANYVSAYDLSQVGRVD
jgi:YD repeat-containing protein